MVKELIKDYDHWAARCGVLDYSELMLRQKAATPSKE